jgi:hypothetical protein
MITKRRRVGRVAILVCIVESFARAASADDPTSMFQDQVAALNDAIGGRSQCRIGFNYAPDGVITWVSQYAADSGLRHGDRLVAIGGTAAMEYDFSERHFGDLINVTIERLGVQSDVLAECVPVGDLFGAMRKALEAGARGAWSDCIEWALLADRDMGEPAQAAFVRLNCSEAARTAARRTPDSQDAALAYEARRRAIEESRVSGAALAGC